VNDIILKVENVTFNVENKNNSTKLYSIDIIKNISFQVERSSLLGITGESGSGKTTLAKLLSGIYSPSSGKIDKYFSSDWNKSLPKPIQILFQNDGELINPYRKVKDVLTESFELKFSEKKDFSANVKAVLKKFQLPNSILNHKGYQLSGGEQQRIALARILITEPEILILDEPFSSQDVEAQLNIVNLIKDLKAEIKLTIICISHDLSILKNISDDILVMYNGSIAESGKTGEVLNSPQNSYTKFLISAQSLKLTKTEIESFHKDYEQN
jgi:ABC-type dipeptide/oligopeptide/nickel transport system ATPase subunit